MDAWDPQTLGLLVFGGFMVVSAVGMALVSLVSMRETSYEDALDQQRRQISKTQTQRSDHRRKEKTENQEKRAPGTRHPRTRCSLNLRTQNLLLDLEPPSRPPCLMSQNLLLDLEPPKCPPCLLSQNRLLSPPLRPLQLPLRPLPLPQLKPRPLPKLKPRPLPLLKPLPPTSSPKEKKKKKKSGKLEPVPAVEMVAKETVADAVAVATETLAVVSASATGEEPKMDKPTKKKKAKAEPEPEPLVPLPYKTLLSSVTEATLSQKEVQRLFQALQQKTSGEPDIVVALKKKLEDKEKQLNNEKKDATAAKTRLRDLTKEVSVERSKMASLETGLRAELLASGQAQATLTQQLQLKVCSLQEQLEKGPSGQLTRLTQENSILRDALNQATSQAESRQNAELARLRQEVLRGAREVEELSRRSDALQSSEERRRSLENKLTSMEQQLAQTQLAHVEKERSQQKRQEEMQEELRRCGDVNAGLQESLAQAQQHEVTIAELHGSLGSAQEELQVLKARLEQPEPQVDVSSKMEELNTRLQEREQQVTSLEAEVQHLKMNLENITSSSTSSTTADSLEAVLEDRARQVVTLETELDKLKEEMETLRSKVHDSGSETESEQPFESLEKDSQLLALEEELTTTREDLEQMKHKNNELREKNWTAVEALSAAEKMNLQRLTEAQQAVAIAEDKASHLQTEVQKCLHVLFPEVSVEPQQVGLNTNKQVWYQNLRTSQLDNWLELVTQKALETQQATSTTHTSQEVLTKLEEKEKVLQAELETNQKALAQAEGEMLSLQRRAEEQERVWKDRVSLADQQRQEALDRLTALEESLVSVNSESENKQVVNQPVCLSLREQLMLLEAQLEKQLESSNFCQTYAEEVAQVLLLWRS
ncbi:Ribosome-binding protein 1 [Merluccius polli]|uniref:Ribosome-binding protein 1 n=1 Tax=Merluccius polli TaxID=89951 RepID=A0AA47MRS9_MERPO|nr:Ribosome-binding protein 1 [Merluccius polli]